MVMLYEVMPWLYYCCIMVMLWLPLLLLRESGEWLCNGCCASQERINVSVVPAAPFSLSAHALSSLLLLLLSHFSRVRLCATP